MHPTLPRKRFWDLRRADAVERKRSEKEQFETEMDNSFALFRRYLNDKAKGKKREAAISNPVYGVRGEEDAPKTDGMPILKTTNINVEYEDSSDRAMRVPVLRNVGQKICW